jgi:hypothetical protein
VHDITQATVPKLLLSKPPNSVSHYTEMLFTEYQKQLKILFKVGSFKHNINQKLLYLISGETVYHPEN